MDLSLLLRSLVCGEWRFGAWHCSHSRFSDYDRASGRAIALKVGFSDYGGASRRDIAPIVDFQTMVALRAIVFRRNSDWWWCLWDLGSNDLSF